MNWQSLLKPFKGWKIDQNVGYHITVSQTENLVKWKALDKFVETNLPWIKMDKVT
jgi:hypothetical protein